MATREQSDRVLEEEEVEDRGQETPESTQKATGKPASPPSSYYTAGMAGMTGMTGEGYFGGMGRPHPTPSGPTFQVETTPRKIKNFSGSKKPGPEEVDVEKLSCRRRNKQAGQERQYEERAEYPEL